MKTWKLTPSAKDPAVLILLGPYDKDFVEALKEAVPYTGRVWRSTSKSWAIERAYLDDVQALIAEHTRAEAPSDLVGLPAISQTGRKLGAVVGVAPDEEGKVSAIVETPEPSYVGALETVQELGESESNAEVWEALELIGEVDSVEVRRVDGELVILAKVRGNHGR